MRFHNPIFTLLPLVTPSTDHHQYNYVDHHYPKCLFSFSLALKSIDHFDSPIKSFSPPHTRFSNHTTITITTIRLPSSNSPLAASC